MTSTDRSIFEIVTHPAPAWHDGGATWLWDTRLRRVAWANQATLELWGARDFAGLDALMDPRRQPGLAALARLSGNLPDNGGRIERLRLFFGGRSANLTCHCAWHKRGRARLLAVNVFDARGRRAGRDLRGGDLARSVLAGLGEAAMAIDESGTLVYCNAPGMKLFFNATGDGTPRHKVRGLETLVERVMDEGQIEGRLRCGDLVVPVSALPLALPGGEPAFIAVHGQASASAQTEAPEIGAETGDADEPAMGDIMRDDVAGDAAEPVEERAKTAEAAETDGPAENRAAHEPPPGGEGATDIIFKPDWEAPRDDQLPDERQGRDDRRARRAATASEPGTVVPFRSGGPASTRDEQRGAPLDPHERDAFRELAEALGARLEGEESGRRDSTCQDDEPGPGLSGEAAPSAGKGGSGKGTDGGAWSKTPADEARRAVRKADLADLLVRLPVSILIYRGGEALFANRAFLDLFGFSDIRDLAARGDIDKLLPGMAEGALGSGNLTARDREGRELPVTARLQAVQWGGEAAMALSVQPAGAPRAAAENGLLTREELAKIIDLALSGTILIDEGGRISALDEAARALFGREDEETVGQPVEALFTEESRDAVRDYLDGMRAHGIASILGEGRNVRARVRGGADLPVFLTLGGLGDDPKRRYCALIRDMSQWHRKEADLVRAREAAEAASRQKGDFIAQMSHEMRTPLNSIIGFTEVIMEERMGSLGSPRYRDYLRDIHDSGRHMLGLVNDLLDLSKVEAGKMDLDFAGVDINEIAVQCIRLMLPEANRGRVIMRSSLARNLPPVVADARSLKQILLNLLSNAIKFTLPGGQVALATTLTARGEVQIRVRDTGIGMAQQDLAVAMEPYGQAVRPAVSVRPGTGLGLPLTKALTEANRARFHIESEDGRGTLTEITFPSQRVLEE